MIFKKLDPRCKFASLKIQNHSHLNLLYFDVASPCSIVHITSLNTQLYCVKIHNTAGHTTAVIKFATNLPVIASLWRFSIA